MTTRKDSPYTFGQRYLTDEDAVWDHNAWDHVPWGEEQLTEALSKINNQKENPVTEHDKTLYNLQPERYWDIFYKNNKANFFKDRKWLKIEFPILYKATEENAGEKVILEVGCGAGNTLFPVLEENKNNLLHIIGVDFSPRAVQIVKEHNNFDSKHASAFVWDLANESNSLPGDLQPNSVDIAVLVFVFSALSPKQWSTAIDNLYSILKPGGKILFRDYGKYDMAQLRFKKNRILEDSFYVRGDGTRVYFFDEEELKQIFGRKFIVDRIATDRRMMVNRQRRLKMFRIWLQGEFTKDVTNTKNNDSS